MNTPALEAGVFFCIAPAFCGPCIQWLVCTPVCAEYAAGRDRCHLRSVSPRAHCFFEKI